MRGSVASHLWRRAVAALLCAALSGAAGIAAAEAPRAPHQCRCHHGPDEPCACPTCHRALAAQAEDGTLPPCHRAAAKARMERASQTSKRAAPCLKGECGEEEDGPRRLLRTEPMRLAQPEPLRGERVACETSAPPTAPGIAAPAPATPPPRSE